MTFSSSSLNHLVSNSITLVFQTATLFSEKKKKNKKNSQFPFALKKLKQESSICFMGKMVKSESTKWKEREWSRAKKKRKLNSQENMKKKKKVKENKTHSLYSMIMKHTISQFYFLSFSTLSVRFSLIHIRLHQV